MKQVNKPAPRAGADKPDHFGNRRHYRHGNFCHHRNCHGRTCRTGHYSFSFIFAAFRLRVCRTLLRRVRLADSGGGSAYTYGYATLGEIFAWIIGWDLVLEYAFGAATVASGWSGYLISLLGDFGIKLPASLAGTRWDEFIYYNNHWEPVKL